MRIRPLTVLIILAGALMLLSHYMFAMSNRGVSPPHVVPAFHRSQPVVHALPLANRQRLGPGRPRAR